MVTSLNPTSEKYPALTVSIFAGAFVFGIVMSSLGALLPALFGAIGFEKADAGRLFFVMNLGMLVSSLLFGPVCDRFGFRTTLLTSTLLIAASFSALSDSGSYVTVLLLLALLGFGGGALNGATNALLNDISPNQRARALNLLGIFFGFGALFTPFFIGSLLDILGLRLILLGLSLLTLAPFALFLCARFPRAKHAGGFSWPACREALQSPVLLFFGLLLFFESGNEFTVGGWMTTYLGEHLAVAPRIAAYTLAGYWTAIMLGRFVVSRVGSRVSPSLLVTLSAVLALLASTGLIFSTNAAGAALSAVLVGLGFAAIFPTALAQVGTAFAEYSGTAFSVIFAMALSGGMTAPWLVGRIAQIHGVRTGFWVTVASCAAIAVLQRVILLRRPRGAG
jgi:FHS family glucose/mannose:H+ symporter-like MFS transporter